MSREEVLFVVGKLARCVRVERRSEAVRFEARARRCTEHVVVCARSERTHAAETEREGGSRSNAQRKTTRRYDLQHAVREVQHATDANAVLDAVMRHESVLRTEHLVPVLQRLMKMLLQRRARSNLSAAYTRCGNSALASLVRQQFIAPICNNARELTSTQAVSILHSIASVSDNDFRLLTQRDASFLVSQVGVESMTDSPSLCCKLDWALQVLNMVELVPRQAQESVAQLPFRVRPGLLADCELCADVLQREVRLARDRIIVVPGQISSTVGGEDGLKVMEQRETAWLSRVGRPFCYSGKLMEPADGGFGEEGSVVQVAADALHRRLGEKYDSVLVNVYRDARVGMRFHSDPGQGTDWSTDTAVVSLGDTRSFVFRSKDAPHDSRQRFEFFVRHGDVVHMFADCQQRYQHAVRSEKRADQAFIRASLVFKQSLPHR